MKLTGKTKSDIYQRPIRYERLEKTKLKKRWDKNVESRLFGRVDEFD